MRNQLVQGVSYAEKWALILPQKYITLTKEEQEKGLILIKQFPYVFSITGKVKKATIIALKNSRKNGVRKKNY